MKLIVRYYKYVRVTRTNMCLLIHLNTMFAVYPRNAYTEKIVQQSLMQNPYHGEAERLLLEEAALAFEQSTGMRAVSDGPVSSGPRSLLDGLMHFDLGHGRTFTMPVEVKSRIDRFATVARLKETQEKLGEQLLLVTNYLSPRNGRKLARQLSFHSSTLQETSPLNCSEALPTSQAVAIASVKQLLCLGAPVAPNRLKCWSTRSSRIPHS
ncbi:hypothetical protein ACTMU2_21480 [Cupriavidus basilensis]